MCKGEGMVIHAFNPYTWEAEAMDLCEFMANLLYKVCPGQPGLQRETLSWRNKQQQQKEAKKIPKMMSIKRLSSM